MSPPLRFYELAHRHLSREATPDETREFHALLETDPSLHARFAALEKIWFASPAAAPTRGFDVDGAWSKLKAQLPSASAISAANPSPYPPPRRRAWSTHYAWLAAAAALVVAATLAWRLGVLPEPPASATTTAPQEIAWDTYESANNRLTVVVLGDGSRVHLSKHSRLRYPKIPLPDRREVFLEGEAYFEVATNPQRPFSVHAPGLVTTVLGTTFNIRAFPSETTRAVSLLTGSIDVARTGDNAARPARLTPGQQLRFDAATPGHELRPIDLRAATGWMSDRLIFQDEPLEAIARALARKFDLETTFLSPELRRLPITADYQGQDLPTILELLRLTTGAHCDLQPPQGNAPATVTFRARATQP